MSITSCEKIIANSDAQMIAAPQDSFTQYITVIMKNAADSIEASIIKNSFILFYPPKLSQIFSPSKNSAIDLYSSATQSL